jgi:hypothetical protein
MVLVRKALKYGESVVGNGGWKKAEGSGDGGKVIHGGVASVAVF